MKAILNSDLKQVSGGMGICLVSLKDFATNTSTCFVEFDPIQGITISKNEYTIALLAAAFVGKKLYDLYQSGEYQFAFQAEPVPQVTLNK